MRWAGTMVELRRDRLATLTLSIMMLMAALGSSVANVALPTISQKLHTPILSTQWVVISYLLAVTTFVVSVGRLADSLGHRRLLLVGVGLFTVASMFGAVSPNLPLLIAARALQGVGAAVMMSVTLAMVSTTVSKEFVGTAMGTLGAMSAVGTALGPSVGGALTAALGWRSIFFLPIPFGVVGVAMARAYLPTDASTAAEAKSFDVAGTLLLALGLASYSLSMTVGKGRFGAISIVLLVAAAAVLTLFVLLQKRSKFPLVDLKLFGDRVLSGGLVNSLLVSTVLMSTLVVGPFYLAGGLQLGPSQAGLVLTVGPALVALCGIPAGRLTDRFSPAAVSAWGLAAIGSGCLLFYLFPAEWGVAGYLLPMLPIASGYAAFQTSNNTLVMSRVESGRRGVVSGVLNLSRNLGLVTGASVMTAIFAAASGPNPTQVQVGQGFRTTFAFAAALTAVALVIAVVGSREGFRRWVMQKS